MRNAGFLPILSAAVLLCPLAAGAQTKGRNVTLTNDAAGELVESFPDGTTAELAYEVPQGREL